MEEIIFALQEEIGNTELFVGREKELDSLLKWSDMTLDLLSQSTAILARRKKGKTALIQRFFNILYTRNHPQIIPFYFKMPEDPIKKLEFSLNFYCSLLSQYLGFRDRNPPLIQKSLSLKDILKRVKGDALLVEDAKTMEYFQKEKYEDLAWGHALKAGHRISSLKGQRIIQILDEFQYLNQYIYLENSKRVDLASSYQGPAESKVSPQIITGSYVGWLTTIIRKMVSRYQEVPLESLSSDESLDAVINYSRIYKVPVSEKSIPFLSNACYHDPYYIAETIRSKNPEKKLTTEKGVRDAIKYETTPGKGNLAKIWLEYIDSAFSRINDQYARAVVLYLAKYKKEERTRKQIIDDLKLTIPDAKLEDRLKKLIKADILGEGSSNFRYRGLGDPIFAMIFRRLYEEEIEEAVPAKIEKDIENQLISLKKRISYDQGLLGEYRLMKSIETAVEKGAEIADLVYNPQKNCRLGPINSIRKDRIYLDHEKSIEIDILVKCPDCYFVIEVKDWNRKLSGDQVDIFIQKTKELKGYFRKKTCYILYSKKGFPKKQEKILAENAIMYTDAEKIESF